MAQGHHAARRAAARRARGSGGRRRGGAGRDPLRLARALLAPRPKTPPCADAILASGVARVVTALEDPDPRVSGRGHARLAAAGVAVTTGMLAGEARRVHRGHIARVTRRPAGRGPEDRPNRGRLRRPRVRPAASDHGRCSPTPATHLLRAHADAVMVGVGTILADDPLLDRAPAGVGTPARRFASYSTAGCGRRRLRRLVRTARDGPTWIVADARRAGRAGAPPGGCAARRCCASKATRRAASRWSRRCGFWPSAASRVSSREGGPALGGRARRGRSRRRGDVS